MKVFFNIPFLLHTYVDTYFRIKPTCCVVYVMEKWLNFFHSRLPKAPIATFFGHIRVKVRLMGSS